MTFSVYKVWIIGSISMILIIYVGQMVENAVVFLNKTLWYIRGGADKSLAQPGRKQATTTKLGIY